MIYDIGPLELDTRRRELSRDGHTSVKITEKAIDVLLALLERHGDWVTKDEQLREVWAGLTVVENSLAQRFKEVRECLETNGVPPPILEYKRGKRVSLCPSIRAALPSRRTHSR